MSIPLDNQSTLVLLLKMTFQLLVTCTLPVGMPTASSDWNGRTRKPQNLKCVLCGTTKTEDFLPGPGTQFCWKFNSQLIDQSINKSLEYNTCNLS